MINHVTGLKKDEKKVREKFGSSKKVPTFAIPFETNGIFYTLFENTSKEKVKKIEINFGN